MTNRKPQIEQSAKYLGLSVFEAKRRLAMLIARFNNQQFGHHDGLLSYTRAINREEQIYYKTFLTGIPTTTGHQVVGKLPQEVRFDTELTSRLMRVRNWGDRVRHVKKHYLGGRHGSESFTKPPNWQRQAWDDLAAFLLANCTGAASKLRRATEHAPGNTTRGRNYYAGLEAELQALRIEADSPNNYIIVPRLTILLAGLLFELSGNGDEGAKQLCHQLFDFYLLAPRDQQRQLTFTIELRREFLSQQITADGRPIVVKDKHPAVGIVLGQTKELPLFSETEARAGGCYCLWLEEAKFTTAFLRDEPCEGEWKRSITHSRDRRKGFLSKMSFDHLVHLRGGLPYFRHSTADR